MKSKTKQQRNPQDATRRNVQAANKRLDDLEVFVNQLALRVRKLERKDEAPRAAAVARYDPRV